MGMRPIKQDEYAPKFSLLENPCECGGKDFGYNYFWKTRICCSCRRYVSITPKMWEIIMKEANACE